LLNSVLVTLARLAFPRTLKYRRKPRLFGKFFSAPLVRGHVGTLFIKLQFILRERLRLMVKRRLPGRIPA
jgi:hypothetical protein